MTRWCFDSQHREKQYGITTLSTPNTHRDTHTLPFEQFSDLLQLILSWCAYEENILILYHYMVIGNAIDIIIWLLVMILISLYGSVRFVKTLLLLASNDGYIFIIQCNNHLHIYFLVVFLTRLFIIYLWIKQCINRDGYLFSYIYPNERKANIVKCTSFENIHIQISAH